MLLGSVLPTVSAGLFSKIFVSLLLTAGTQESLRETETPELKETKVGYK